MTDKNRIYILELYKIVSPTSILVVDQYKKVKRLHCPFRVIALDDIPPVITEVNIDIDEKDKDPALKVT